MANTKADKRIPTLPLSTILANMNNKELPHDIEKSQASSSSTPSPIKRIRSALTFHKENYKTNGQLVRDSIIGFADGITVPFALTAGLSSLGDSKIVIIGGLAELFAGSISMGLGAFLAAVTEKKHYEVEEAKEKAEIKRCPMKEEEGIYEIFDKYGIQRHDAKGVVEGLKVNEEMWVQFMMDFELKLFRPAIKFALLEGLVMGASYFIGGLFPMIPYFIWIHDIYLALYVSIGLTAGILLAFGYVKAILINTGHKDAAIGALQTLCVGGVAAAVSYGVVRGINERIL